MIITDEIKKKVKTKFESICYKEDYLQNRYELYEIYDGFNQDENPDYFKTHLTIQQKVKAYDEANKAIMRFCKINNINLWEE